MDEKYEIKGIEKIIEKVGKKQLAEYYQVGEDADFINLLTESLKSYNVPNGLEIATYETMSYEDVCKLGGMDKYTNALYEKYVKKEEKALVGINFGIIREDISDLYFYIDKPIQETKLQQMNVNKFIGGVNIHGYEMRK